MRLCLVVVLLAVLAPALAAEDKPEVFLQLGHTALVQAIAVSPDGSTLAVGDFSGQVKLWDTTTRQEVLSFPPSTHPIMALAFAPDGKQLYDGTANGWLGILDVANGNVAGAWQPMRAGKEARAVAVSIASGWYAIGGLERDIRIIDGASKKEISNPRADNAYVTSLAFTPDGATLVGGDAKTIRIWDAATGALRRSIPTKETVLAVAITPDGKRVLAGFGNLLAGSDDRVIRIYDLESAREVAVLEGITGITYSVAVSPDGMFAASAHGPDVRSMISFSADKDKSVRLWDLRSGKLLRTFKGHDTHVMSVAWHPDGRTIYSASWDKTVRAWAVATGESAVLAGVGTPAALISADNAVDAMTGVDADGRVWRWDLATGRVAAVGPAHALPDNYGNGELPTPLAVRVLNGTTHTLVKGGVGNRFEYARIDTGGPVQRILFDANGVPTPARAADKLRAIKGVPADGFIVGFADAGVLTPDARTALVGISYMATEKLFRTVSVVTVWELAPNSTRTLPFEIDGKITAMTISGDGRTLLLASEFPEREEISSPMRRTLEAREIASGRQLWRISDFPRTLERIAVSPKSDAVLVASEFEALLVGMDRGDVRRRLGGHTKIVSALAFAPDGRHALTGSVDQRVRVWDLGNGANIATFFAHVDSVEALAFAGDGRFIVSAGADQTLRLWKWPSAEPVTISAAFRTGDWVTLTPEGYFAGSPGGAEQLGFRYRGSLYSLNQFYDAFYRPDLVQRKLRGEALDALAPASLTEALNAPPPVVRIDTVGEPAAAKVNARIDIRSTGGGIGEIRVFHNGKLVRSDGNYPAARTTSQTSVASFTPDAVSRALITAATQEQSARKSPATARPDHIQETLQISPVPGENEIAVIAFNRNNTVQSRMHSARFVSVHAAEPPRLFVLAVGIDKFRSSASDNLAFAAKDARDFTALLGAQQARLGLGTLQPIRVLTDAEATRDGILREFARLQKEARPQDALILFIASHGVINAGAYAIVTHDYAGTLIPSATIAADELIEASKRIAAQRQLMILDTCHAGGLDLSLSGLYDERITLLARNVGLHAYASAGTREQALDGYEENGLFTHALLRGLRSGEADANRDRDITVFELGDYGKTTAAAIARRSGFRQTPLIIRFGKDLSLLRLD